jgi:hypothetical protein
VQATDIAVTLTDQLGMAPAGIIDTEQREIL